MRRFRFRLERLLEVRRYIEKQWEAKLAEKTGQCASLRNRIQDTRRQLADSFHGELPLDLAALLGLERFRARLEQERSRLERELAERLREREEILQSYREASRARKVLDKLKEKRAADHLDRQRREESRILDEIAGSMAVRTAGGQNRGGQNRGGQNRGGGRP